MQLQSGEALRAQWLSVSGVGELTSPARLRSPISRESGDQQASRPSETRTKLGLLRITRPSRPGSRIRGCWVTRGPVKKKPPTGMKLVSRENHERHTHTWFEKHVNGTFLKKGNFWSVASTASTVHRTQDGRKEAVDRGLKNNAPSKFGTPNSDGRTQ